MIFMPKTAMQLLRHNLHMTQKQVAEKLDMPLSTYQKYENNKRKIDFQDLCKIADFYQVSLDFLMMRDGCFPKPILEKTTSSERKENELLPEEKKLLADFRKLKAYDKNIMLYLIQNFRQSTTNVSTDFHIEQMSYPVKIASRSQDGKPIEQIMLTQQEIDEIQNAEDIDPNL